jgi:hypothetical protein
MTTTHDQAGALRVGSTIEVELATGECVIAGVNEIRRRNPVSAETVRRRSWSRWSARLERVPELVDRIVEILRTQTQEEPQVHITLLLTKDEAEEHYSDVEAFRRDLASFSASGVPWRIRDIRAMTFEFGPTYAQRLAASVVFTWDQAPAVRLEVRGGDRVVVTGLHDRIASEFSVGSKRIPAPNMLTVMIVGGILGFGYFWLVDSLDFSFLPANWIGNILSFVIFFAGYLGMIFGTINLLKISLPSVDLKSDDDGDRSWIRKWGPKLATRIILPLMLGLAPVVFQQIFFSGS